MSTTITQPGLAHLVNASEAPAMKRHRLTQSEAADRVQLLGLFDKLDARGQRTTLAMLAVAVKLHPREA